jgi:hypothetical protein
MSSLPKGILIKFEIILNNNCMYIMPSAITNKLPKSFIISQNNHNSNDIHMDVSALL